MTPHTRSTGELDEIIKQDLAYYGGSLSPEARRKIQALIRTEAYRLASEVIGEDFVEVTKFDKAINGVLKMQRSRLQSLVKENKT